MDGRSLTKGTCVAFCASTWTTTILLHTAPLFYVGLRPSKIEIPLTGEWYRGVASAASGSLDDRFGGVCLKLLAVKDPGAVSKRMVTFYLGALHR